MSDNDKELAISNTLALVPADTVERLERMAAGTGAVKAQAACIGLEYNLAGD